MDNTGYMMVAFLTGSITGLFAAGLMFLWSRRTNT